MPKRFGQKAIDPVAQSGDEDSRNAICISPDAIAQTTTGTSRMRAR